MVPTFNGKTGSGPMCFWSIHESWTGPWHLGHFRAVNRITGGSKLAHEFKCAFIVPSLLRFFVLILLDNALYKPMRLWEFLYSKRCFLVIEPSGLIS